MDEKCGTCRFFDRMTRSDAYSKGLCRRNPPVLDQSDGAWPQVHKSERCGEYKPRSQVRDHRDQWERGPVNEAWQECSGCGITGNLEGHSCPPISSGRVEAGGGEERCGNVKRVVEISTGDGGYVRFERNARCIFRAGHEGKCAFSMEG